MLNFTRVRSFKHNLINRLKKKLQLKQQKKQLLKKPKLRPTLKRRRKSWPKEAGLITSRPNLPKLSRSLNHYLISMSRNGMNCTNRQIMKKSLGRNTMYCSMSGIRNSQMQVTMRSCMVLKKTTSQVASMIYNGTLNLKSKFLKENKEPNKLPRMKLLPFRSLLNWPKPKLKPLRRQRNKGLRKQLMKKLLLKK